MSRELPDDVAAALRAARQSRGFSLRGLGRLLGVSHTAVRNWERGIRCPSGPSARALASVLDLPADAEARLLAVCGPRPPVPAATS